MHKCRGGEEEALWDVDISVFPLHILGGTSSSVPKMQAINMFQTTPIHNSLKNQTIFDYGTHHPKENLTYKILPHYLRTGKCTSDFSTIFNNGFD